MHIIRRLLRVQMVRNLSGAAVGATLAMLLYSVYTAGSSALASLFPAPAPEQHVTDTQRADNVKAAALRAKTIMEGLH